MVSHTSITKDILALEALIHPTYAQQANRRQAFLLFESLLSHDASRSQSMDFSSQPNPWINVINAAHGMEKERIHQSQFLLEAAEHLSSVEETWPLLQFITCLSEARGERSEGGACGSEQPMRLSGDLTSDFFGSDKLNFVPFKADPLTVTSCFPSLNARSLSDIDEGFVEPEESQISASTVCSSQEMWQRVVSKTGDKTGKSSCRASEMSAMEFSRFYEANFLAPLCELTDLKSDDFVKSSVSELKQDMKNLLSSGCSRFITKNENGKFEVSQCVTFAEGLTVDSVGSVLKDFCHFANNVEELNSLLADGTLIGSVTCAAFVDAVRQFMDRCVLEAGLILDSFVTGLVDCCLRLQPLVNLTRFLLSICRPILMEKRKGAAQAVVVWDVLCLVAGEFHSTRYYSVVQYLLARSIFAYNEILFRWLYRGTCEDAHSEFFIKADSLQGKKKCIIVAKDHEIPSILQPFADEILKCLQTMEFVSMLSEQSASLGYCIARNLTDIDTCQFKFAKDNLPDLVKRMEPKLDHNDHLIRLLSSQDLPFNVAMQTYYETLLMPRLNEVSAYGLQYVFTTLHVERVFQCLQGVFLLADGVFVSDLLDRLFSLVTRTLSDQTIPANSELSNICDYLSPVQLNSLLYDSLEQSPLLRSSSDLISFKIRPTLVSLVPGSSKSDWLRDLKLFYFLDVHYAIEEPLHLIVPQSTLDTYNRLFHFLLSFSWVVWSLKDVTRWLAKHRQRLSSNHHRRLHVYRHEMQHFVLAVQGFFQHQLVHVAWAQFQQSLQQANSIQAVCLVHQQYLDMALNSCLLSKRFDQIAQGVERALGLALRFRSSLTLSGKTDASSDKIFARASKHYQSFHQTVNFLCSVVTRRSDQGFDMQLEELLGRLNCNKFYT